MNLVTRDMRHVCISRLYNDNILFVKGLFKRSVYSPCTLLPSLQFSVVAIVAVWITDRMGRTHFLAVMVCLHWPTPRPRPRLIPKPMELGFMIMLGNGYTKPMQISIGSVHILLVSVSVSCSVNEPFFWWQRKSKFRNSGNNGNGLKNVTCKLTFKKG